ncbi:MAG: hypothetical protein GY722_12185 [bacterium]|nr:hypothetical protein [bacterium]
MEVLKTRHVGGEDRLILRRPSGGTFPVARDWTDRADPTMSELLGRPVVHDFQQLCELVQLIKDLGAVARGSIRNSEDSRKENLRHGHDHKS